MARVRGTIEMLAKILRENGASKIKAETFRQAKFNQDEAVPNLWRLLFELVYFCQYEQIDEVAVRAFSDLTQDELVTYVKHELQGRGFHSYDFALLPPDYGHGSRELLLAVGWLMCKEHILDRFIMKCTSPLDDDEPDLKLDLGSSAKAVGPMYELLAGTKASRDPHERVEQLLWLNNKMRLNLRGLLALQRQKNCLQHQLHQYTEGVTLSPDRNHLSALEVYMLRHPELLKKNMQLLEHDNERLQNLLDWRQHEDIFWKWMESVLDAKLAEAAGDIVSLSSIPSVPSSTAEHLVSSHLNLREAIVKYESIIDHLERLWGSKDADISSEELDSVLASIDLELSMQRANIAVSNTQDYISRHQPRPAWNYVKGKAPSSSGSSDQRRKGMEGVLGRGRKGMEGELGRGWKDEEGELGRGWKSVEGELGHIQGIVNELNSEVECRRSDYQDQLQRLTQQFTDTICIPPMKVTV